MVRIVDKGMLDALALGSMQEGSKYMYASHCLIRQSMRAYGLVDWFGCNKWRFENALVRTMGE